MLVAVVTPDWVELAKAAKAINYQMKYEILKLQQWKATVGAPAAVCR